MENTAKALLIAGAIIICVLIVSVGMYIYNSSQGDVMTAMASMSTQEIEVYNSKYTLYEGEQTGADIKSLVGILITNSNVNKDDPTRIPGIYLENAQKFEDSGIPENGDDASYKNVLEQIRKCVEIKHKYWVEISYQNNGLVDYITISYDKANIAPPLRRN